MSFEDLKRLLNYLKSHMHNLLSDSSYESYTFTDYNLAYQMQASCGYISPNIEESYFSVTSMINIGKKELSGNSTYIGGESTITFKQVEQFINSLEEIMILQ